MKAAIVFGVGLAWALFVALPTRAGIESFAISVAAALAPYAALAAVSGRLQPGVPSALVAQPVRFSGQRFGGFVLASAGDEWALRLRPGRTIVAECDSNRRICPVWSTDGLSQRH
jgi:hypothetical protein